MSATHNFNFRIYYEDTDAGGIVYNANYLKFAERARTEMLRDWGFKHSQYTAATGKHFVVRACKIDYKAPAVLDDKLTVQSMVKTLGGSSLTLQQDVYRGEELLVEQEIVLVCINGQGRPVRIPDEVRDILG